MFGIEVVLGVAAVSLLTLGTAFFVGAEFALVATDRNKIESSAGGNRRAGATAAALKTLSFQLSGAQLGITITTLLTGYVAEPLIAEGLSPLLARAGVPEASSLGVAVTLALVFATAVQMVLGELVPKNLAIARPIGMSLALAPPLRFLNELFRPLILVLNGTANWTVRRLGIEPRDELELVRSLEEIEILVQASRRGGLLDEEEYGLLARSLTFGGKTAADSLVPRTSLVALRSDASLEELAKRGTETGFSRFPVYGADLDDLLGIALVKDCFRYPRAEWSVTPVERITSEAPVVPESRTLESLLLDLRRARKHMAIVVDEHGGTAGVITVEDLLEEIVGEIEDEYDRGEVSPPSPGELSGVHVLSGMLHPDEVQEACGLSLPDGDFETLAGFLLTLFDRVPNQGDHVGYDGWELKVVEMDGNRIAQVLAVALGDHTSATEAHE